MTDDFLVDWYGPCSAPTRMKQLFLLVIGFCLGAVAAALAERAAEKAEAEESTLPGPITVSPVPLQ
jgi:hypothetical protein